MKKLTFIAAVAIVFGITSCGSDDVVDLACDQVGTDDGRAAVEAAIDFHEDEGTAASCSALKTAIAAYEAQLCADQTLYDAELAALPSDCETLPSVSAGNDNTDNETTDGGGTNIPNISLPNLGL